jgi:hypothetical protein
MTIHVTLEWNVAYEKGAQILNVINSNVQKSILKGSDDGALHLKESGFWALSVARFLKNTTFLKKDLFPSSGKMKLAPTLLGPLERVSFYHWTSNWGPGSFYLKKETSTFRDFFDKTLNDGEVQKRDSFKSNLHTYPSQTVKTNM